MSAIGQQFSNIAHNVSKPIDNTSRKEDEGSMSCKICRETKEKRVAMEHLNRLNHEINSKFEWNGVMVSKSIADTGIIIR